MSKCMNQCFPTSLGQMSVLLLREHRVAHPQAEFHTFFSFRGDELVS